MHLTREARSELYVPSVPVAHTHIGALDGIRGAAILLVVAHHLAQSVEGEFGITGATIHLAQFGWVGVDLFFVLSGFLITGILFDSKTETHFFRNFYARRALRIFPLYFGALFLVQLVTSAGIADAYKGTASPIWLWLYLSNFVIAWKGFGAFGTLDHFWSLAIEEHFYLMWPFIVWRFDRTILIRIAASVLVFSLCVRVALVLAGADPAAPYVFTPARIDTLAMGALIALLARGGNGIGTLVPTAWLACGASAALLALIAVSRGGLSHDDPVMETVGFTLLSVQFGSWIVLGIVFQPARTVFTNGTLRWFGKYSYGLYVWHPLVFIYVLHSESARALRGDVGAMGMAASVALAVGLSILVTLLSWHLVEARFLSLKKYFR